MDRQHGKNENQAHWVLCTALLICAGLLVAGCDRVETAAIDAAVDLQIKPDPPRVGEATVALTLTGPTGKPLEGAELTVEGNMNHAGMTPVFADLTETEPGHYEGTLEFTMAGDWFLLVTGTLPDGRRVHEKIDVPGVRAK